MLEPQYSLVYCPYPTKDSAISAAEELLEKQLVACCNIIDGCTSLYLWKGETQKEAEILLLAKTTFAQKENIISCIEAHHPYEVPCISFYALKGGNSPFFRWIDDCLEKQG